MLENLPPHNDEGTSRHHLYMPWWLYEEQKAGKLDFARGYHVEFGGGRGMPGAGHLLGPRGLHQRRLRQAVQGRGPPLLRLLRVLRRPRRDDPQRRLATANSIRPWSTSGASRSSGSIGSGVPTKPTRPPTWSRPSPQIIESMGGKVGGNVETDGSKVIAKGGQIIHEVGTVRMGDDAEDVGAERALPDLGRQEPVRHRRGAVRLQRRQEPDASRSWRWPGAPATTSSPNETGEHLMDRRDLIKTIGALRRRLADPHRAPGRRRDAGPGRNGRRSAALPGQDGSGPAWTGPGRHPVRSRSGSPQRSRGRRS